MTPVRTAIREHRGERHLPGRRYTPADLVFAPEKDAFREIVVDWQMPSDADRVTHDK